MFKLSHKIQISKTNIKVLTFLVLFSALCISQPMKYTLDKHIDSITFTPWNAKKSMTWEQSLWENYTEE